MKNETKVISGFVIVNFMIISCVVLLLMKEGIKLEKAVSHLLN